MAKRTALKGCFLLLFVIVVLVIGIVAWQVLSDDNSSRSSNDSSSSGGFFGSGGLFGDDDNNTTASPPSFTTRPRATPAPNSGLQTDAPTIAPTIAPYPFNQCSSDSAQCCNGVENICDFPVNEVMFGVVHNAMATTDSFLFPNHERPMEEALEAGFRGVNLDVCLCNGVSYKLCHGQCGIGEADPTTEFSKIVSFLNQNPNEVIILTIEVNNGVNLNDFYDQVLSQVDGFQDLLYVHNNATDPWPTMGTLIDNNTVRTSVI